MKNARSCTDGSYDNLTILKVQVHAIILIYCIGSTALRHGWIVKDTKNYTKLQVMFFRGYSHRKVGIYSRVKKYWFKCIHLLLNKCIHTSPFKEKGKLQQIFRKNSHTLNKIKENYRKKCAKIFNLSNKISEKSFLIRLVLIRKISLKTVFKLKINKSNVFLYVWHHPGFSWVSFRHDHMCVVSLYIFNTQSFVHHRDWKISGFWK